VVASEKNAVQSEGKGLTTEGDDEKKGSPIDGAPEEREFKRIFGVKVPKSQTNQLWALSQVFWFAATLFLSFRALKFVPVPLYVVARNLVPAQTALLEKIFNSKKIVPTAGIGLLLTVVGAVVYQQGIAARPALIHAGGNAYEKFSGGEKVFTPGNSGNVVTNFPAAAASNAAAGAAPESHLKNVGGMPGLSQPAQPSPGLGQKKSGANARFLSEDEYHANHAHARVLSETEAKKDLKFLSKQNAEEVEQVQKTVSEIEAVDAAAALDAAVDAAVDAALGNDSANHKNDKANHKNDKANATPRLLADWKGEEEKPGYFTGLIYAALLTTVVAVCSVVDKFCVRKFGEEEGFLPVEVNQMRVAGLLPLNIILAVAFEFYSYPRDDLSNPDTMLPTTIYKLLFDLEFGLQACIFFSTIFGFGIGTFNLYLQKVVNAATVQVANIGYKLTTTIISRVTHPEPVTLLSWFGFAISLGGIYFYTFPDKMKEKLVNLGTTMGMGSMISTLLTEGGGEHEPIIERGDSKGSGGGNVQMSNDFGRKENASGG
jgi:drug/metabolite transporter (DMT)-like permease